MNCQILDQSITWGGWESVGLGGCGLFGLGREYFGFLELLEMDVEALCCLLELLKMEVGTYLFSCRSQSNSGQEDRSFLLNLMILK